MTRKNLSYNSITAITRKKFQTQKIETPLFCGYVSLIQVLEVDEPQFWDFRGEKIPIWQTGYQRFSILPREGNYCIAAILDENDKIVFWYIDIIASQGVDGEGVPYFDDLYLDLIVCPNGEIIEDDRDELEEALKQGDITRQQFELADRTGRALREGLLSDIDAFQRFTYQCLSYIK